MRSLEELPELAILNRTKQLILGGWCKGHYARTNENMPCHFLSTNAELFCIHGALYRAEYDVMQEVDTPYVPIVREAILSTIRMQYGDVSTIMWNDSVDRDAILAVLNTCIDSVKARMQPA